MHSPQDRNGPSKHSCARKAGIGPKKEKEGHLKSKKQKSRGKSINQSSTNLYQGHLINKWGSKEEREAFLDIGG